jgi:hypothetical protein
MLVGLLLALGAALTTGVASVLQALAARRAHHHQVSHLVVSPLYLGGTALDVLGFVCIVGALHWLPLFLVQCAAASSVGVTALVGRRVLATVLRRRDIVALLGLGAGLVLLAAGAKPEAATAIDRASQWWLVVASAPVIVGGLLMSRLKGTRAGGALATLAGLAFAGTGVASRILSNSHSVTSILDAPSTYALIIFGLGGMVFFAASLQRTRVTIATAALFGVETLAASAVGLAVLGDSTRAGFGIPTAVGFVITLGCAVALALTEDVDVMSVTDEPHRHAQSTPPLRAPDTP